MNRLQSQTPKIGLIGHVVAGYPSVAACKDIVKTLAESGASAIEVQFPFSEPTADGPLFLAANQQAIASGMTTDQALEILTEMAATYPKVAFVVMTYANILYRPGLAKMCEKISRAGAQAVICPDWPFDSGEELIQVLTRYGLGWVPVIAPTTAIARAEKMLSLGSCFAYLVARTGVTGEHSQIAAELKDRVREIGKRTKLPIAVGFGIQSQDDIRALIGTADFAIIGSQSLRTYVDAGLGGLQRLWSELSDATKF